MQFPAEKGKEVFVSTEVRRFNFLMAMSGAAPARSEQFLRVRVEGLEVASYSGGARGSHLLTYIGKIYHQHFMAMILCGPK